MAAQRALKVGHVPRSWRCPGSGLLAAACRRGRACARALLTPCQITHPLRLTVVAAECGVLEVPENPAPPAGRLIGLHVARVPAINRRKQADALFVLAGGPGQGAEDFYASVAPAFSRIHRDRDIVLLDQRGTGASHALTCPEDEERLYEASSAKWPRSRSAACTALSAQRGSGLLHHQHRRAGPGARARCARLRAHRSLRSLLRHARRAAVPAALSGARARTHSRWGPAAAARGRPGRRRAMPRRRCTPSSSAA